ncbi:MAG: hypothetical protein ACUVTW_07765 [Thermogutta sp.]
MLKFPSEDGRKSFHSPWVARQTPFDPALANARFAFLDAQHCNQRSQRAEATRHALVPIA